MPDLTIFAWITVLFVAGGTSGLILGQFYRRLGMDLALTCALLAGLLAAYAGMNFWEQPMDRGQPIATLGLDLPGGFPSLALVLFIDRLAAFFLVLAGLLSALVALYSLIWLADKKEVQHHIAGIYNFFVLFAILLLIVNDVYFFLLCLESLTLAFSYLTLYRHNRLVRQNTYTPDTMEDAKLAFKVYLIFSHVGVVFVTTALLLLALMAGKLDFDTLRLAKSSLQPVPASIVFLLALTGLGIKGGFFPAHIWVALVHPQSPTTTHALTLGLIIKITSFYILIRVLFEFLPASPPLWWGWVILLIAGLTALAGVFYAITGRDLKTALSHHSVENIGIILAGIGLALLFSSHSATTDLASLALIAGLYHLLNHTVFKSLLYLGTGAIENRTGTVEMEELGGLMARFPWTSVTFLVGAVAIAGFPPLNGFISEWLILQAIFAGLTTYTQEVVHMPMMVGVAIFATLLMLGTAFGLTALAFTKIVGETVLGAPRRPHLLSSEKEGEVPWAMRGPLVVLALLCLLLGLLPGRIVPLLARLAGDLLHHEQPLTFGTAATTLTLNLGSAGDKTYTAGLAMLPLLLLAALPFGLVILIGWRSKRQVADSPWTCGTAYNSQAMQITGSAFAFLAWRWAGGPASAKRITGDVLPWRLPLTQTYYVREFFREVLSAAVKKLELVSKQLGQWVQGGDIRYYLTYLFAIFLLVLIFLVIWQGT